MSFNIVKYVYYAYRLNITCKHRQLYLYVNVLFFILVRPFSFVVAIFIVFPDLFGAEGAYVLSPVGTWLSAYIIFSTVTSRQGAGWLGSCTALADTLVGF